MQEVNKMSRKIKLDAAMGVQVMRFLSDYATLPASGIVAGQSVASAIDAIFGSHAPVVNDVDVFRKVKTKKSIGSEMVNSTAKRQQVVVHNVNAAEQNYSHYGEGHYEGMQQMLSMIDTYAIQSVSRDGMLNFVNCTTASGDHDLTAAKVLSGFDLNCVRVAVDLQTQRLIWDSSFERFVATRQLEIAMLHTPYHTMVRFLRKLETLPGVYGDVGAAAEICAGISKGKYLGKMMEAKQISLLFGQKMYSQCEAVQSRLDPYFELQSHKFRKDYGPRKSGWMEVAGEVDHDAAGDSVELWGLSARGDLDSALQRKMDRMGPMALTHGPRVIYEARRAKSKSVAVKFGEMREIFCGRRKSAVGWNLNVFGEAYVEGHALEDIGEKVDLFLRKHTGFTGLMLGLTLGQQYEMTKRIKAVCKEFDGDDSLGVLETQACAVDLLQDDFMREVLRKDAIESQKPFKVIPMQLAKLPAVFNDYTVRELLTRGDLRREGRDMGHCVGGYTSLVRANRSRVLSIRPKHGRDKSKWSTVELRDQNYPHGVWREFGKHAKLVVVQHRSHGNDPAPAINQVIVDYLVEMHGKVGMMQFVMRLAFKSTTLSKAAKAVVACKTAANACVRQAEKVSAWLKTMSGRLEKMAATARAMEQLGQAGSATPEE